MNQLRQIVSAVILFCFAVGTGWAQEAADPVIFVDGVQMHAEKQLLDTISRSPKTEWPSVVVNWYHNNGFLDAIADSFHTAADPPEIYLTGGCKYVLAALNIDRDASVDQALRLPSAERFEGKTVTNELISEITALYLPELEQAGFLTAGFKILEAEKNRVNCTVEIHAELITDRTYRVQGIRFDGVVRNNPEYLQKVTGIGMETLITPDLMERGRRNLLNTDLFTDVSAGELIFVNGEPYINYEVTEQQLNFFDGLIGYVPRADGSGQLAGYGDILLRNALADGNHLELRYEQLQPRVSKLDIRAGQQFIGGLPLRAEAGLSFVQQDTLYLVRNISAESGYRLFTGFELIGTLRAERSSVSRNPGTELTALDSRARFYGLGFRFRQLDRITVPTRGIDTRIMLEQGRRFINDERLEGDSRVSFGQTILRASLRGYYPVTNRLIMATTAQAFFLESPEFIITDLHRFGGANTLRGFREDQFRASSVVWGDLEPRFLLTRNSYIFVFGAYGIFERPALITETTDQFVQNTDLKSFGFGIAFQSPVGMIKFSYAISPDDNLSDGKVHVGISTGI